jgi:hypothetical protein
MDQRLVRIHFFCAILFLKDRHVKIPRPRSMIRVLSNGRPCVAMCIRLGLFGGAFHETSLVRVRLQIPVIIVVFPVVDLCLISV